MSRQVAASERQLVSRFRQLAQVVNEELGFRDQRLRFGALQDRTGVTVWKLQNPSRTADEERSLPDMVATLQAAPSDAAYLEFAFTEHWIRRQTDYAFKSSNLRFAVVSTDPGAQPLQFRLEWAGPEQVGKKYVFPGKGSAHPHWQFNGELRGQPANAAIQIEPQTIDVALAPDVATVNLEALTPPADIEVAPPMIADPVGPFPWFHKLHLPARALWSEVECRMPDEASAQQHPPASTEELDRWVVSALRYMRHEFSSYSY